MNKVKQNFINNAAIYLVLFVCLVVVLVAFFVTNRGGTELEVPKVDTSLFQVVTLDEALELFETDEPKFLVIGLDTCTATINYVPSLQIAEAKFNFKVYYLELSSIDNTQLDSLNQFIQKLDIDYKLKDTVDKFGKFIQTTPGTVIIKNKKQVFGYYGSMNITTLETIAGKYGLINN